MFCKFRAIRYNIYEETRVRGIIVRESCKFSDKTLDSLRSSSLYRNKRTTFVRVEHLRPVINIFLPRLEKMPIIKQIQLCDVNCSHSRYSLRLQSGTSY